MDDEPIRLDHVSFGVHRMADAMPLLVGELGGTPCDGGPGPGYEGAQWSYDGGGRLEVIEPAGEPGGFLHRFLAARGPGVHHVTFRVPSLVAACDRARELGYDVVGLNDSSPRWKEAFLHPKQAHGLVIQLAQHDPSIPGGSWSEDYAFPPSPPPKSPPARVLRLVMSMHHLDSSRRQWRDLLQGNEIEADGMLRYSWADSPIGIGVRIDPTADEGPVALEVSAPRELELPVGVDAVLGARFARG